VANATTLKADTNTITVDLTTNGTNNELNSVDLQKVGTGLLSTVSVTDKDTAANGLTIGGTGTTTADTDLSTVAGGATTFSGQLQEPHGAVQGQHQPDGRDHGGERHHAEGGHEHDQVDLTTSGTNNELNSVDLQKVGTAY